MARDVSRTDVANVRTGHYRAGIDTPPDRVDPPAHHRLVAALLTALVVVAVGGLIYGAFKADDTPPRPAPTTNPAAPAARSVPTVSTTIGGTRLLINWSPPASCGGVRELAWWIDDHPGNSAPGSPYDLDEFALGALRDRWTDLGCGGKFPTD